MTTVLTTPAGANSLSTKLQDELNQATEIWIAVALMNQQGFNFLTTHLNPDCKQHYLIGTYLPTQPQALYALFNHCKNNNTRHLAIYHYTTCFHPKLYLIKKKTGCSSFVGSANCTNGGLNDNIELTTYCDDKEVFRNLKTWFNRSFTEGVKKMEDYIRSYEVRFRQRAMVRNINPQQQNNADLIRDLTFYRQSADYADIVVQRNNGVTNLKNALDFPNFQNINLDAFFEIEDLGALDYRNRDRILMNMGNLIILLNNLTNQNINIIQRYNDAICGGLLHVDKVGTNFITKVLCIYQPNLYYVENSISTKVLRQYGFQATGASAGARYANTCQYLIDIANATGINDLALLDNGLYLT